MDDELLTDASLDGLSLVPLIERFINPAYPKLSEALELWDSTAHRKRHGTTRVSLNSYDKFRVVEYWETCAIRGLIAPEWLTSTEREYLGGCACGASTDRYLDNLFHIEDCKDKFRPSSAGLAVVLASDAGAAITAESRLREVCAALVPWGLEPLKQVLWCSDEGDWLNLLNEWDFTSSAVPALTRATQAASHALMASRKISVIRARKRVLATVGAAYSLLRTAVAQRKKPRQRRRMLTDEQATFFQWLVSATLSWNVAVTHELSVVKTPPSRKSKRSKGPREDSPQYNQAFLAVKNPMTALFALYETGVDWVAYERGYALLRWQPIDHASLKGLGRATP